MREFFISRRNLLKSAFIGLVSALTSREAFAATSVIKISIAKRSTTEITFSVEATETVKCYLEYGYAKDYKK